MEIKRNLIGALSTGSGPHSTGPTPDERGRRACSYGVGLVPRGPEPVERAPIGISLNFHKRTIDYRFVVTGCVGSSPRWLPITSYRSCCLPLMHRCSKYASQQASAASHCLPMSATRLSLLLAPPPTPPTGLLRDACTCHLRGNPWRGRGLPQTLHVYQPHDPIWQPGQGLVGQLGAWDASVGGCGRHRRPLVRA